MSIALLRRKKEDFWKGDKPFPKIHIQTVFMGDTSVKVVGWTEAQAQALQELADCENGKESEIARKWMPVLRNQTLSTVRPGIYGVDPYRSTGIEPVQEKEFKRRIIKKDEPATTKEEEA